MKTEIDVDHIYGLAIGRPFDIEDEDAEKIIRAAAREVLKDLLVKRMKFLLWEGEGWRSMVQKPPKIDYQEQNNAYLDWYLGLGEMPED